MAKRNSTPSTCTILALGGGQHAARFRDSSWQRASAQHVLARAHGFVHERRMRGGWRGDRNDLHGRILRASRSDVLARGTPRSLARAAVLSCVTADQRTHLDAGVAQGAQVREHAETGTHDHGARRRCDSTHEPHCELGAPVSRIPDTG